MTLDLCRIRIWWGRVYWEGVGGGGGGVFPDGQKMTNFLAVGGRGGRGYFLYVLFHDHKLLIMYQSNYQQKWIKVTRPQTDLILTIIIN